MPLLALSRAGVFEECLFAAGTLVSSLGFPWLTVASNKSSPKAEPDVIFGLRGNNLEIHERFPAGPPGTPSITPLQNFHTTGIQVLESFAQVLQQLDLTLQLFSLSFC